MDKHITLLAALKIGLSAMGLLVAAIVFVIVVGAGLLSGDQEAITITSIVGSVVAFFLILTSAPGIVGGIGLLRRWPWARLLVLVLSVLDLMNIPIGTAVGIYAIWVLMQDETAELFA